MNNKFVDASQEKVLSSLAKGSGIYAIAKTLNIFSGFIAFGLLARNFAPNEFGKLEFLFTAIIFIANVSIFGQDQAVGGDFLPDTGEVTRGGKKTPDENAHNDDSGKGHITRNTPTPGHILSSS